MSEDFYETLGVDTDASQADIEHAYRERVKETHPDVSDAEGTAEEFKRVVRAEEVLGDADERARYDRLGHAVYVNETDGYGTDVDDDDAGPFGDRWKAEWTEPSEDDGPSHHARQRARRRAAWFSGEATGQGEDGQRRRGATGGRTARSGPGDSAGPGPGGTGAGGRSTDPAGGTANAAETAGTAGRTNARESGDVGSGFDVGGFGRDEGADASTYSVHDWEDEELVEEPVRVTLTQEGALLVGAMFFLYPVFVYSSLTPMFPLLVNLFVGACTLVVMGYLLTLPRVAMAVFGAWSAVTTLAMLTSGWSPLSVTGLVAVMATYVPFGYSVAVARLLRER